MRPLLALLIFTGACAAYREDIGPLPYRCSPDEPRCPDGYNCQNDITTGEDVCVGNGSTVGGDFQCADDSATEPNNMLAEATATGVDGTATFSKDGLAICPAGDRDLFAITLSAQTSVEILVDYQADGAELATALLNAGGVPIANSAPVSGETHQVRAVSSNLPAGQYYAQVAATIGGTLTLNNYKVSITVPAP
jgi:hypothetical protein